MCSDKWRINGAPGQGEAPLPDAAEGNPRGRGVGPSPSGGAESSIPAGPPSPYRESGCSPRPVLPTPASVVSSWALGIQGRTLPGVEAGVLGLSRARTATRAKVAPGGTPGSTPLQSGRDHPAWGLPEPIHSAPSHPQLQDPRAAFLQGRKRSGLIYTSLLVKGASLPGRAEDAQDRPGVGGLASLSGPELGRGDGPASPERAPEAGFVAPGKSAACDARAARSAELGSGAPPSPILREAAARALPGLASISPTAHRGTRSKFPHLAGGGWGGGGRRVVIAKEPRDQGFGPEGGVFVSPAPSGCASNSASPYLQGRRPRLQAPNPAPGPARDPRRAEGAKAGGEGGR